MNVLNRSGAFIFGLVLFLIHYRIFYFGSDQPYSLTIRPVVFMWGGIIGLELRNIMKNDWYLYKFYPIDFFDRNYYIILIYLNLILFFYEKLFCPVITIFVFVVIIANDFFVRVYNKKKKKKEIEIRDILGHSNYNAEAVSLKSVNKNFFLRSWPFVVVTLTIIFVELLVFKIPDVILGITIVLFAAYEFYSQKKIYKELKEILGEEAIVTD